MAAGPQPETGTLNVHSERTAQREAAAAPLSSWWTPLAAPTRAARIQGGEYQHPSGACSSVTDHSGWERCLHGPYVPERRRRIARGRACQW